MKKRIALLFFFLLISFAFMSQAWCVASAEEGSQSIPAERQKPLLVDDADLITTEQEDILLIQLEQISQEQKCEVAIVTVDSLEGKTPRDFADDFYDYNGYGYGEGDDGILLLISMADRDWHITTHGFGITAFTDAGLEYLSEQFLGDLGENDFYGAFCTYAKECDRFLTQAHKGKPYDVDHLPIRPLSLWWIPISLGIGIVLAYIVVIHRMLLQHKTVRMKANADSYVRKGSMKVTVSNDVFLHSHVTRRKIETSSSSHSGGSSTHRSSSGRSHGGSGGKF